MILRSRALALGTAFALLLTATPDAAPSSRALTLSQALSRAVSANPSLAAAQREIGAASGRGIQLAARPNPELSFELDDAFGSKAKRNLEAAETTLQISQLFERADARSWMIGVAVVAVLTA